MTITRRQWLAGLGASPALLPFLPLLESEAGELGFPKRLVLVYTPLGVHFEHWRCTGSEKDFQLSPILAPLEPYKDKLVVLDGVDCDTAYVGAQRSYHQNLVSLWTGRELPEGNAINVGGDLMGLPEGPSVDQFVADSFGLETPLRSLELGVNTGDALGSSAMIHRGANEPVPIQDSPYATFERVFADSELDPEAKAKLRDRRIKALDLVAGELGTLRGRVPASDRHKLEAHLSNLEAVQDRVLSFGADCAPPTLTPGIDPGRFADFRELAAMQMDLLAASLACDATRVASLLLDNESTTKTFFWLGHDSGIHEHSHQMNDEFRQWNTWLSEQFRELLDRLASYEEGGETMLDHTLVVWASGMGRSQNHSSRNIPIVLAGGCAGAIETGRLLRYGSFPTTGGGQEAHGGEPVNNLLVSICRAMGLGGINTFGNPDFCTGPLPGL